MSRLRVFFLLFALILLGALLLSLNGCSGSNSGGGGGHQQPGSIQYVVIIFQENRTPDNLFQDQVLINRGADIVTSGKDHNGNPITLTPVSLITDYDLSHSHHAWTLMYDGGKMDGADLVPVSCAAGATGCPPTDAQFQYVNPSEVASYFAMAEQYTFGDHMFQTNQGPSFPAHQFIISGTSAPSAPPNPTSNLFASENLNAALPNAGCVAAPGTTVALIDPSGSESQSSYPCYEHPTLTDLLDQKGISWRYYAPSIGSIWTGPNAIKHICQPQTVNGTLNCTGSDWANVAIPETKVLTDIANRQLAHVSWVIPNGHTSDHALENDGTGPAWVASIVNAIGNSPYWANTAIIITWDDWGGWYDHVAPKVINSYEYGFRVPLIVVSPYAKAAYISSATHDFGSILKFIENNYGLGSLGYADAPADDLSDCFNLFQTPLQFQQIPAAYDASHFLNDPRPPTDPDDD